MPRFEKQNESEKASYRMIRRVYLYKNAKLHNAYIIFATYVVKVETIGFLEGDMP